MPDPRHSGHGKEHSREVRVTVIQRLGAWPGHASRRQLSLELDRGLEYVVRGEASIFRSYIQVFLEKVSWGHDFFYFCGQEGAHMCLWG